MHPGNAALFANELNGRRKRGAAYVAVLRGAFEKMFLSAVHAQIMIVVQPLENFLPRARLHTFLTVEQAVHEGFVHSVGEIFRVFLHSFYDAHVGRQRTVGIVFAIENIYGIGGENVSVDIRCARLLVSFAAKRVSAYQGHKYHHR